MKLSNGTGTIPFPNSLQAMKINSLYQTRLSPPRTPLAAYRAPR